MRKDIVELKENFEELGLRTIEILDFKVLAKSLDQDRFLKDDFELVDLDKFREIQNTLLNEGLFETACKNFRNLTDEIRNLRRGSSKGQDQENFLYYKRNSSKTTPRIKNIMAPF